MFIPSFGEIFVIILVSVIFLKTEDWFKIFSKWRDFRNFIIKFSQSSKEKIIDEINEIEKEILKTKILNKDLKNESTEIIKDKNNTSYEIFSIGSKKYILGEDKNLHEIFDFNKKD